MSTTTNPLPLVEETAPDTVDALAEAVRRAAESRQPIYPLGGRTALDFGRPPTAEGIGLSTTGLDRVIEFDPQDMTVTVEAGITMSQLALALAAEGQELPIDVPRAGEATLGGVVVTNWNGPRRYGRGTIRDYVIGIHAVDGRGVAFKSGGRVMKNVAGYDFCKLLTGSLGTLAIVTRLTLKVGPRSEVSAMMTSALRDWKQVDDVLSALNKAPAAPVAVTLVAGSAARELATLALRLEGTAAEIASLQETLGRELASADADAIQTLSNDVGEKLCGSLVEFPDQGLGHLDEEGDASPLVAKIIVRPSKVVEICRNLLQVDPACAIVAHAGNGVVLVRFSKLTESDASSAIVGRLRPAATKHGGSLVVLRSEFEGLTRQIVWGGRTAAHVWMENVKRELDPHGLLNPGRFVY